MLVLDIIIKKDVANNIKKDSVLNKYSTQKKKNIKRRYVNCNL